jgi:hypothetical protein
MVELVPTPETQRQNLTQPAAKAPIPSIVGYFDNQQVLFVHTEASDPDIGAHLTRKSGSPVVVVPALADVPEGALADVYVFANGVSPEEEPQGPMGYQADVFDTAPGDPGYSPLRAVKQVQWSDDTQPRMLRSASEVTTAADAGELAIQRPGVVLNMPFVTWPDGTR